MKDEATAALYRQYLKEIAQGQAAKLKYAKQGLISYEDLLRSEKPMVTYTAPKGQVSTDEPPFDVHTANDTIYGSRLMAKPVYEELNRQLLLEKLLKRD